MNDMTVTEPTPRGDVAHLEDATDDLRIQADMEVERANFDTLWQDVAEHLLPRQADMLTRAGIAPGTVQGQKRSFRILDETAMLALDRGVAVAEGYSIPRGTRWQNLAPLEMELMKLRHVRAWYELKTQQLFALRTAAQSGFDTQAHESWASLLAFGNQGMWPELLRRRDGSPMGLFYRSEHIGSVWVRENAYGRVDKTHRKFWLRASAAVDMFGAAAPECAVKAVRDRKPDEQHEYLQVLEPNRRQDPRRADAAGMAVASRYVSVADRASFSRGGYRTMPLVYSRYEKSPTETYGRGPGVTVLPAVRACQRMMRDLITAIEFLARPALLAPDDAMDMLVQYFAGGVTYGGLDDRGNKLLQPMFEGIDLGPAKQLLDETRVVIGRAFFNDLFLAGEGELKSHVSAAAIMEKRQEKGLLMAPVGRQETEWFGPMADREIDLMGEMGLLDDMPGEVREAGGAYQLRYENPLARSQKAEQAGGFFQLMQAMQPIIAAKPDTIEVFLNRYPVEKIMEGLAWIFAVPAAWEADETAQAEGKAAIADAGNVQQMLTAAPIVADVVSTLGEAGAPDVAA